MTQANHSQKPRPPPIKPSARSSFYHRQVYAYAAVAPGTDYDPAGTRAQAKLRSAHCEVTRINLDGSGKRSTGVTFVDSSGEEWEQPAAPSARTAQRLRRAGFNFGAGLTVWPEKMQHADRRSRMAKARCSRASIRRRDALRTPTQGRSKAATPGTALRVAGARRPIPMTRRRRGTAGSRSRPRRCGLWLHTRSA